MKVFRNFIFYTPQGYCSAPNSEEVDNFQVLGFAEGRTKDDALAELLQENRWISQMGYDLDEITFKEII